MNNPKKKKHEGLDPGSPQNKIKITNTPSETIKNKKIFKVLVKSREAIKDYAQLYGLVEP